MSSIPSPTKIVIEKDKEQPKQELVKSHEPNVPDNTKVEKGPDETTLNKSGKATPHKPNIKTQKLAQTIKFAKSVQPAASALKKPFPLKREGSSANKLKAIVKLSRVAVPTNNLEEEQAADENSLKEEKEKSNEEYSLHHQLIPVMKEVSRQKLRSLRMALRKIHASSDDGTVTINEAKTIFIDLKIHLHSRLLNFLIKECVLKDEKIHHEKIITYFQRAHAMSGRDSVEAIDADEIDSGLRVQLEITDAELYRRAEIQLMKSREAFDLELFRKTLKKLDVSHSGILQKHDIEKIAITQNCFIYGSLLHTLLGRSDQSKNNQIRWPEFVNFLEKLYKEVTSKHPDFEKRFANKVIARPIMSRDALRNKFKDLVARTKAMEGAQKVAAAKSQSKSQDAATKSTNNEGGKKNGKDSRKKSNPKVKATKEKMGVKTNKLKPIEDISEKVTAEPLVNVEEKPAEDKGELLLPGVEHKDLYPSDDAMLKNKEPSAEDLPTDKLKIEWVYGFRGQDVLCNLDILSNGELVYFTGRVVVLFDFIHHSQRHYCEHTEDIRSLALHFDGIVVASAQREHNNKAVQWSCRIWRTDSLSTLYILNNDGGNNQACPIFMRFSPIKNWLLVLDDSNDHVLSLWDIKGQKLASISTSRNQVQSVACDRKNENIFVTVGMEHILWWEYLPNIGEIQMKKLADHRGFLKARITLTLHYTHRNDLITGDSNGTIYIWGKGGNGVTNYIKHAHESFILALCMYSNYLLTGDKRGQIMLWSFNKNLDNLGMIMLPQGEGGVRHMLVAFYSSDNPVLIIGTTSNSLLQLPLAYGDKVVHPFEGVQFGVGGLSIAISQGHFGYLDCVSQVTASDSWFITAGRDGQICVFDGDKCLGVQKTLIKGHQFTCVQWITGDSIVLGTVEGRCIILGQQDLSLVEIFNKVLCSCSITSIFTFPNDKIIYIGSLDGGLTTLALEVIEDGTGEADEKWMSTFIQTPIYGIDFIQGGSNEDKSYVWLSNKSGNYVAYEIGSLTLVENKYEIKNIIWSQQQCGFIPNIAGAWMTPLMVEEEQSCASINRDKAIVVIGTMRGTIAVYKYPCLNTEAYCHSNITSQPVTSLLFLRSGERLISVAGNDSCITQWKVV